MKLDDKTINLIYQDLDTGMVVYIHKDTHEVLSMLDFDSDFETHDYLDAFQEELDKIETHRESYIQLEKMPSREAYNLMVSFVQTQVVDPKMEGRLAQVLEGYKPFASFNHALGYDMDLREKWFAYKAIKYKEYVRALLTL